MKVPFSSVKIMLFLPLVLPFLVISTLPSYAQPPVIKNGTRLESPFTRIYEKVAPCVVTINVKGKVESQGYPRNPLDFFSPIPRRNQNERPYKGMGSGVIIDREGHILTNNHVIESPDNGIADQIMVTLYDGEEYEAE